VMAIGNDSVFYSKKIKRDSVRLPVNPAADQTTFEFVMIDSIRYDTLSLNPIRLDTNYYLNKKPHIISVSYTRGHRIITESCGVEISYTNLKPDTITFPAYSLISNKLSRLNKTNLEIYF